MSYRGRPHPLARNVVDIETARRAVSRVASERDALARQLQRAQSAVESLQRQLEARTAENDHLAHALRGVDPRPQVEQVRDETGAQRRRFEAAQHKITELSRALDEAIAEGDRERAACQAAIAQANEVRTASPDEARVQNLAADLANLRRRQEQAIEQGIRGQTDRLLSEIASIRDSVQRAIATLPGDASPWHDGLWAVLARIDAVLEREGVTLVGAPGERFDPRVHEAIGTVEGGGDVVRETVSRGLVREDGSVITSAKVLIGPPAG